MAFAIGNHHPLEKALVTLILEINTIQGGLSEGSTTFDIEEW